MPRIGATISGLEQLFLNHLAQADEAVIGSAIRLSTGNQYNRPADDPSAFLEISQFERRLSLVQDTKKQVEIAAGIGAETQLVLDEIRTQLDTIREALVLDEGGALSAEERLSEQADIDAAIEAINDLARTEIHGRRYLDGSVNYRFAGKNSAEIREIQIYSLGETDFSGNVTSTATQAEVTHTGVAGLTTSDATFTLSGKRGSTTIEVSLGTALSDVADVINEVSHDTGITAVAVGDDLTLTSVDYGQAATIDIDVSAGSFSTAGTTQGSDAVVTINGQTIDPSAIDGNRVQYASNGTHVVFEFRAGFSGAFNPVSISDTDVAQLRLTPDLNDVTRFGVSGVSAALLGGLSGQVSDLLSGGDLAGLDGNTSQALRVVDEALAQLSRIEGGVDAFADVTVESAASLLDGLEAQLEETVASLKSVNEEEETLLLTKNQSLGTNAIASISILQQQQANMLSLVRLAAGI